MTTGSTIHINAEWLALLSGAFIPLVVGALSKLNASGTVKAILNGLLSAVAGAVSTAAAAGGSVVWQLYVVNIVMAWLASVATYYGFWKPSGTAVKLQTVTRRFGIGRSRPVEVDDWINHPTESKDVLGSEARSSALDTPDAARRRTR